MADQQIAQREVWADIPMFPHHEASSLGRIRRKSPGKGMAVAGRIFCQRARPNGYLVVSISGKKHFVHRLVCAAFHGQANDREVSHENGVKSDNRAENLRWRSHKENEALKDAHGTKAIGSRCGASKLTELQATIIRSACRLRMNTHSQIADFFGVTRSTVGDIANGRTWTHI